MADNICRFCGRKLDVEGTGLHGLDESKGEEDECLHCHFCMYEDCHVFLNRSKRLCEECRLEKNDQAR